MEVKYVLRMENGEEFAFKSYIPPPESMIIVRCKTHVHVTFFRRYTVVAGNWHHLVDRNC